MFPSLKHLEAIDPLFITIIKTLGNKKAKTFCKEFKLNAQTFKDFLETVIFSVSFEYFIIELAQGKS